MPLNTPSRKAYCPHLTDEKWAKTGEEKDPRSQSKSVAEEGSETSQTFLTSYNEKEKRKEKKNR